MNTRSSTERYPVESAARVIAVSLVILVGGCGGGTGESPDDSADEYGPYLVETRALVDAKYANDPPRRSAASAYVEATVGLAMALDSESKQQFFARQARVVMCTPIQYHDAFDGAEQILFRQPGTRSLYVQALQAIPAQVIDMPVDC